MVRRHHTISSLATEQISSSTTGAGVGNAASLDLGKDRQTVDAYYNVTTNGLLQIDVSLDNSSWNLYHKLHSDVGGEQESFRFSTAFRYVRFYADGSDFTDSDINTLILVSRGA